MKYITKILKKLAFALFIIYLFNRMAVLIDIYIPVNFFTLLIVGFLEIFGLILLIILKLMI